MKKLNTKHIVLSILLTATLASGNLQAQESGLSLMGIFNSAKQAFKEANRKRAEAQQKEQEQEQLRVSQQEQDYERLIAEKAMNPQTQTAPEKVIITEIEPTKTSGFQSLFNNALDAIKEANRKKAEADKKLAEEQKRLAEQQSQVILAPSEKLQTKNSVIRMKVVPSAETKWIMFEITKGNFTEVLSLPVKNGKYYESLALKEGAGVYTIRVFQNANESVSATSYIYLKTIEVDNSDERDTEFLLPTSYVQSNDPQIVSLVKQLTMNARNQADGIKAIHDYIVKTVKYDYESYKTGAFKTKDYNALDVLRNPVTVCTGYSMLFAAMARAYGVKAKVVYGKGDIPGGGREDHAWNEVFVNGDWKIVDSTWDATNGVNTYKYFFIDEESFSIDHTKEQEITMF